MLGAVRWWFSLQRNANFGDWVKATYSPTELKRLVEAATDTDLLRPFNPFGDATWAQHYRSELLLRRTTSRLYERYGPEIWSACFRAAGLHSMGEDSVLYAIAELRGSNQVYDPITFEEFLVRHALRQTALELLPRIEGRARAKGATI
jgi:hypothetical protein